jgi:hypothetical protein
MSTPIATPLTPEPLDAILSKSSIDVGEKIKQVSRAMRSMKPSSPDTARNVLEQLPNLLLLLKESMWLGAQQDDSLFGLFSLKTQDHPFSIAKILASKDSHVVKFVLPLTSLPMSTDWTREDFTFFHLLNFTKRGGEALINLSSKTMTLDAIDYYFFLMALLPTVVTSTSYWKAVPDCVYDRLIAEIIDVGCGNFAGNEVAAVLAHKCALTLAAMKDFYMQIDLYSFNNTGVDFAHVFRILRTTESSSVMKNNGWLKLLLNDMFDRKNFYMHKFLLKVTPEIFKEIALLYKTLCGPISKQHDDANIPLYREILLSPPVVEFAQNFHQSRNTLDRFVNLASTRDMLEGLISIMSFFTPDPSCVAATKAVWSICRSCCWINGKAPRNLSDLSWKMDEIVNDAKSRQHEMYKIFTWDHDESLDEAQQGEEGGVPKILRLRNMPEPSAVLPKGGLSWDQPVCFSEIAVAVHSIRKILKWAFDSDLKDNQYAWLRKLASVSVLLAVTFATWVWTSVAVCPRINSPVFMFLIQFAFASIVACLSLKWINSQYIV